MQGKPLHEKRGMVMIIVGAALIPTFLVISKGYLPNGSILDNLYLTLTVYSDQWFCHPVPPKVGEFVPSTECTSIVLRTKYLVGLCFVTIGYGLLVLKSLAPDPIVIIERITRVIDGPRDSRTR